MAKYINKIRLSFENTVTFWRICELFSHTQLNDNNFQPASLFDEREKHQDTSNTCHASNNEKWISASELSLSLSLSLE